MKNNNLHIWLSLGFKVGVFVTLGLVAVGLIIFLASENKTMGLTVPLNELTEKIIDLDAAILISLGITTLLFTPIIQVIIAAAKFSFDRDKLYLGICLILLCMLALNIFLSIA
jgi:uncharacterized membrane protein